jgi:dihydrofolate synthase/folylpolyglutamate synthase
LTAPRDYLFGLEERGIKFGLSNIRYMLQASGNPQLNYRTVHVAGTNGKGSVVVFLASVLRRAGFSVGRYTSPHLIDFSERIVVDDVPILDSDLDKLILRFQPIAERMTTMEGLERPTYFEFGTALAFEYFSEKQVDFAVIETGLGGRLDSTNVIEPEVVAITNVDIDHTLYLGDSLSAIAFEKAGIIRGPAPVVTATRYPEALDELRKKCRETGAQLYVLGDDFNYTIEPGEFPLQRMSFSSPFGELRNLVIPLAGSYQGENAAVAAMVCQLLQQRYPLIAETCIRDGFASALWRGRFELVRTNPLTLIDGGHNPSAAAKLAHEIRRTFPDKEVILVLAVSGDKDAAGIVSALAPVATKIIVTQYSLARSMLAEKLYPIARRFSTNCIMKQNVETAIAYADSDATDNSLILITGSLYIAGEALQLLSRQQTSAIDQHPSREERA